MLVEKIIIKWEIIIIIEWIIGLVGQWFYIWWLINEAMS